MMMALRAAWPHGTFQDREIEKTSAGRAHGQKQHAHLEEVDEEVRVLLQVEGDGLVVHLRVGHLDGDVLELDMLPGGGRVRHHDQRRVVVLVVGHVQEDKLAPVLLLLAHTDEARDVEARRKQLQVLHQLLRLVLGVQDACVRQTNTSHTMGMPGCRRKLEL